jgi:outer membrane protein OmpA-like peptidoglycan-associated protein
MTLFRSVSVLCVTALFALAGPALAQSEDLSTDEIKDAFNKQKTRGLVIVPSGQSATAATGTSASAQTEVTTTQGYTAVDRADQVNIKINFDFDSAALREDEKPKLANLCEAMKAVDVAVFQIIGHTDSSGSASYNQNLSLLRAEEVKRHMVSNCGIEENRLEAIGLGESAPFNTDDPRSDENRRVEFQALG